jgi:ribonuclease D
MDRRTERLVNRLKRWRQTRAPELSLDPGVLCPNASLEAIAWKNPQAVSDLEQVTELKRWFVREFGEEVTGIVSAEAAAEANAEADAQAEASAKAGMKPPAEAALVSEKQARDGGTSGAEPLSSDQPRKKKRRRRKKKKRSEAARAGQR